MASPIVVAQAIAADLAELPQLRVRIVRGGTGWSIPAGARSTQRPRVTLVVAGTRRVLAPVDGVVAVQRLRRGDALLVAADGWSLPLDSPPHRFIAVDCDDRSTRFDHQGVGMSGAGAFHSAEALHPAAWHLLLAALHLGADQSAPQSAPHSATVLELALRAALVDCRPWPDTPHRDAHAAWSRARARARDDLSAGRDAMAAAAGVHPNHLSRLCRRFEGCSLVGWLSRERIDRARQLLAAGLDVAQVATACGYAESSHFRRMFRTITGTTPGAWCRSIRLAPPQ